MIALTREMAGYTDPGKEVYDVLLDKYEEGMDSATIDRLFGELKEALIPLVKKYLPQNSRMMQSSMLILIRMTREKYRIFYFPTLDFPKMPVQWERQSTHSH